MIDPETLDDATAYALARQAVEDGGCVDCRFRAMSEWAPQINWAALRQEAEKGVRDDRALPQ